MGNTGPWTQHNGHNMITLHTMLEIKLFHFLRVFLQNKEYHAKSIINGIGLHINYVDIHIN